jgi:division/cell wall cluster transcriptional repressor MraZ
MDADARQVQRNVFSTATHLVPDKLGRIVLPQYLRAHARLGTEVVIAGVGDRIEIWDQAAWERLRSDFLENGAEQVQRLANRPAARAAGQ